jgi:radical SAM protein with 4Fe4S-binding SPASM domain
LESNKSKVHDEMQGREGAFMETLRGINHCIDAGLVVSINATLTKKNYKDLRCLIDLAKELGVNIVSTNAIINSGRGKEKKITDGLSEEILKETLTDGKSYAEKRGVTFNWFLPSCYKRLNPIELGFGQRCCSACQINMMIEPNGDVIPCQSWTHEKLGNILEDSWNSIWNGKIAKKIRNNKYANEECMKCEFFNMCKGGCPLDRENRMCKKVI